MANKKGEVYFGENENNNNNKKNNNNENTTRYVYENNNNNYVVPNNNNNRKNQPKSPSQILSELIQANDVDGVKNLLETRVPEIKSYLDVMKKEGPYINLAIENIDRNFEGSGSKGAMEIFNELLKAGFSLNQEFMGNKPIHMAAGMENEKAAEILLKILVLSKNLSADGEKNDKSPLLSALAKNHYRVADLLFKMGADKNKIVKGTPLLHDVVFELKNLKAAEFLLNKGANVNQRDLVGDTVLHKLIKSTLPQDFLVNAYNVILNSPHLSAYTSDALKRQPLYSAVYQGNLYAVKRLLDSPRRQFITVVELQQEPVNPGNWDEVSDKTPFLLALKRSSYSPDSPEKDPAKEPIYNQILKELIMKKYENTKRDWDRVWIHMRAAGIPLSTFIQKILELNELELLEHFIKNGIIDKSFSIDNDNLLTFSLKQLEKGRIGIATIKYLLDLGLDPNAPGRGGVLPMLLAYQSGKKEIIALLEKYGGKKEGFFIAACQMGFVDIVKDLIKEGESPTQTVKISGKEYTGLDLATSMRIKLLLAPYFETEEPRFLGFKEKDFLMMNIFFLETVEGDKEWGLKEFGTCPICFQSTSRNEGCQYIDHDCKKLQREKFERGEIIHIHEKLYETYNEGGRIKWCVYCNRLTTDRFEYMHKHYDIGPPVPVPSMRPDILTRSGNPYAKTCHINGGGDTLEKIWRFQELIDFMCYLNKKMKGKISQNIAYNLAKEAFIGAPFPLKSMFTSYKTPEQIELLRQTGTEKEKAAFALKDKVLNESKFNLPDDCGELTGASGTFKIKEAPNIPRPAQNADLFPKILKQKAFDPAAIEQPPVPPVAPSRNLPAPQYIEAFQKFQTEVEPYKKLKVAYNQKMDALAQKCEYHGDRHSDGRELYQFFHRQPDGEIYDHQNYLICKEGLLEYIRYLAFEEHKMDCFDRDMCEGFIHPLEIKDLMTTDEEKKLWDKYRQSFNVNPPIMLRQQRGGQKGVVFTSFMGIDPHVRPEGICPIPSRNQRIGGRRTPKTRKISKKLKARQVRRTRKH